MPLARVPEQSVEAGAGSHGPFRSDRVSSLVTDTSPWRGGTKEVGSQERDPAHLRRNPRVLIASPSAEVRRRWRHGLPTRFSAEEIAARTALEQGIERQRKPSVPVPDGSLDGLTFREREIAQLIGGGARNKEISSRLNITEATVKKHLTAIFRKLKLSDRLCLGLFLAKQNRSEAVLSLLRRSG